MAQVCPACGVEIPGGHLNIADGLAQCPGCRQFFPYEILTGAEAYTPFVVAKPPGCAIDAFRDANSTGFILPPLGVARSGGLLLAAVIWNAIIGSAIGTMVFSQGAMKWLVLPFMAPFVAVGIYLAVLALFGCYGTASLLVDREKAVIEKKLFGKSRTKSRPLSELQAVALRESYKQNNRPIMGVALVFKPGPRTSTFSPNLMFAVNRPREEQDWMISELRQFLVSIGHPAATAESAPPPAPPKL